MVAPEGYTLDAALISAHVLLRIALEKVRDEAISIIPT
jgi:hypothetical protein